MIEYDKKRMPSLARRLLTWYAVAVLVVLLVLGVVLNGFLKAQLLDDLTDSLESQALLLRSALGDDASIDDGVLDWARQESLRVTLISDDGTVVADSSRDVVGMENHAQRPEVVSALAGSTGVATRVSSSVGVEYRYVAVPLVGNGPVVRVAEPVNTIVARLAELRTAIALAGAAAALVGVIAVWLIAQRIARPIREATESAVRIAAGDSELELARPTTVELRRMADTVNHMAGELRRRAQQSEAERLLRDQILDTLDEGVILIGPDDSVAYVNTWATTVLGARRTLAGLPGPLQELAAEARSQSLMVHGEFQHGVPPRRLLCSSLISQEAGGVLMVLQDVTEASRVTAMRQDFVADASHELKTPISVIQAGSETVLRALDEDPAAARAFAEQVHNNAVRLGRIVGDLLDLSRLETEEAVFENVRLDELVKDEVSRLAQPSGKAPVQWNLSMNPIDVFGSRNDLRLATRNLLDNAQRYAAGGRVDVSVAHSGDEAIVEVVDDGIGIPTRDLPRVFERFYRVDEARSRHTGGTGLGLAIVKHVAERHGGRVDVESELGAGSTFRLYLPMADRGPRAGTRN